MRLKKLDPMGPEVTEYVLKRIEQMTAEEALALLTHRKPGVPETDMTGMFRDHADVKPAEPAESDVAPVNF